jgi:phosphoglycolate phosphatase-like HAD superfamily hydrolase
VFSDYPAVPKLVAMGVANFFDIVVTAQDPEVQKVKPNPRGLEVTLERLGVEKHQALYIGDRPETDGAAAYSAGLACVILGRRNIMDQSGWIGVSGYGELRNIICGG